MARFRMHRRRRVLFIVAIFAIAALMLARPCFHILRTMWAGRGR